MEAGRAGAIAKVENPMEEILPAEEDRMDETVDVGTDATQAGDVKDSKAATNPIDRGYAV